MATPYTDSGTSRSLMQLMMQRGQNQAAAHLQRGDASARMWQGVGDSITGAVQGWQQQVERNRLLEMEQARESRRAEAEGLQLEASKLSLGEAKRQARGRETARNVLPLARRQDGVYGVDRDLVAREMEAAGHGDMLPDIFATLDEQETSYRNVLNVRKEAISSDALRVLRSGSADEETFDNLLELWEKNDLAPKADIDALRKAAQTQGIERALVAAVSSSEKGQQALAQMQEASRPKLRNVNPGDTVIDERNPEAGALFTAPAKPETPNNIEAAILAETDPTKRAELIRLKEQFARAGRAPAAPPAAEPLVAVIGDDGRPVMLPRSQAVGRQPASTRETGRQVTSGDANDIADFNTALDDMVTLGTSLSETSATGATAKAGAMLPNWMTEYTGWGSDAKKKQALIDRVKQTFGKTLEGGVLRKEDEAKYEKILPTIGDPNDLVVEKITGLAKSMRQRHQRKLDALESAGYDVSRFAPAGAPAGGGGGGARVGERRTINGQLAEWDGKGWAAVED